MDKCFKRHVGHLPVYLTYLCKGKFTGQHRLLEPQFTQVTHLLRRAIIHLRAGMQGYGRQVHLQQSKVLHYQGIHSGMVQFMHQAARILQFPVIENGIERHVNAHAKRMGIVTQAGNIVHAV